MGVGLIILGVRHQSWISVVFRLVRMVVLGLRVRVIRRRSRIRIWGGINELHRAFNIFFPFEALIHIALVVDSFDIFCLLDIQQYAILFCGWTSIVRI